MQRLAASFVLGYHGCDATVAEKLLAGDDFKPSKNDYDWLGHGIYFWEANPRRALEFAQEVKTQTRGPDIKKPEAVGAVIDLGLCLDLTTSAGVQQIRDTYREYVELAKEAGYSLPQNSDDWLRRNLDCAVINFLHRVRNDKELEPIDTVRTVFTEGQPIFEGSGFLSKSHMQICVCNPDCIKGVFRIRRALLQLS
ncbi:MAG: hypothetical protein O7D27_12240 [Alphaproteobacteria bacterium]|nr:hypothetical protein [Alphaproteobacteria bacterium]MCZ6742915.1 hypothetical protein [Alphaproteobacteria bacterium]MCZ6813749.1 hypothetical protein [Alphaproteobacteria bacterium]MCZ6847452.1 hypothetical protein [Alphaproteobacteria bacterium]